MRLPSFSTDSPTPKSIISDITLAVSPDGSMLVYVANVNGIRQLVKKEMNSFEANPIAGTEGAVQPFFSPDGEWIGYLDSGERKLKKISIHGGAPTVIGGDGRPRTEWIERRPERYGRSVTFLNIGGVESDDDSVVAVVFPVTARL